MREKEIKNGYIMQSKLGTIEGEITSLCYKFGFDHTLYHEYKDRLEIVSSKFIEVIIYKNPNKKIIDLIYTLHANFKLDDYKVLKILKKIYES